MRLVTWNCYCGDVSRRLSHLARLRADVVVLQEVAQPGLPFHDHPVHWRGTNPRKGVAITSCSPAFTTAPVDAPPEVAPRTAAVTVHGPTSFLLVAMWAHPAPNYADNVIAVVRAWQARASGLPLVVAGDFNVDFGSTVQTARHRRLGQFLHEECGLVSAYHAHRNLRYGHRAEVPTYRHLRKAALPWHIDYCFVPAAWRTRLTSARVVEGEHWLTRSDHSPVVVDLAD